MNTRTLLSLTRPLLKSDFIFPCPLLQNFRPCCFGSGPVVPGHGGCKLGRMLPTLNVSFFFCFECFLSTIVLPPPH